MSVLRVCRVCLLTFVVFISSLFTLAASQAETVTSGLQKKLEGSGPGETVSAIVELVHQADLRVGDRAAKLRALSKVASSTQADLLAYLESQRQAGKVEKYRSFRIFNGLALTATKEVLLEVAARPEVKVVREDRVRRIPPIRKGAQASPEWNIAKVRANEVWADFGITGEGVVVGSMDTGVDYTHPDVASQFLGDVDGDGNFEESWFDAVADSLPFPYDDNGHGTHTMGTILGGEAGGTAIGVAPGARWIAAKILDDSGTGLDSWVHAAFDWIIDPDGDPGTDDAPDVVNNSWGSDATGDTTFWADIAALVALDIFPCFAIGNDGPDPGTAGTPGNFPHAFGVGATDLEDMIAGFSSRGPSSFGGIVKPDVSAPGVAIRSSVPGGGYEIWSGTSMAAPHVTGGVALLRAADSTLTIEDLRNLLEDTAPDLGEPGKDNDYGAGRIDLYQAVGLVATGGTLAGAMVDSLSRDPIAGASITVLETGRRTFTDPFGGYSMLLPAGDYTVEAAASGYVPDTTSATIVEDSTTIRNFALLSVDIEVEPPAFDISVAFGTSVDTTLTISNVGVGDLEFAITVADGVVPFSERVPSTLVIERILERNASGSSGGGSPGAFAPGKVSDTQGKSALSSEEIMRARERFAAVSPAQALISIAVLDSWGADNPTAWDYLNANWRDFGDTEIIIDYTTLNKEDITYEDLVGSGADVLLISDAWSSEYGWEFTDAEREAIARYVDEGHGLVVTSGTLDSWYAPNTPPDIAPLLGLDGGVTYIWGTEFSSMSLTDPGHPVLHGVSDPYYPGNLYTVYPLSGDWNTELTTGEIIAISPDNIASIVVNEAVSYRSVYLSNGAEYLSNPEDYQVLYNSMVWTGEAAGVFWLSVNPTSGTVPAGGSMPVMVTLDADSLPNSDYYADLLIDSNDPYDPQVTVPVQMRVYDAPDPDIEVRPDSLSVAMETGQTEIRELWITNRGDGPLLVSSISDEETGVLTDADWLSEDPTSGVVAPGDSMRVKVTFDTEGLTSGTDTADITIANNDPDEGTWVVPVELIVSAPDITIDPTAFDVPVEYGMTLEDTLTIRNEGDLALQFDIRIVKSSAPPDGPLTTAGSGRFALISDGTELDAVAFILDEMGLDYDVFNYNGEPGVYTSDLGLLMGYSTVVWYASGSGGGGRQTTSAEHDALEAYLQVGGNLLVTGYDTIGDPDDPLLADLIRSSMYGDGPWTYDFTVIVGSHPIMDGPYGSFPTGTLLTVSDDDHDQAEADVARGAVTVAELSGGRDKLLATELGSGGKVVYWNGNSDMSDIISVSSSVSEEKSGKLKGESPSASSVELQNIFRNTLSWLAAPTVPWLSVAPSDSVVAPGDFVEVVVTFDAAHLPDGDYYADLIVVSNDPDESSLPVPVHMNTFNQPPADVAVAPDSLSSAMLPDEIWVDTLMISNEGAGPLAVREITDDADWLSEEPDSNLVVSPGDSLLVEVTFNSAGLGLGTYSAGIAIVSNDEDESPLIVPVELVVAYPDIVVVPREFDVTLAEGRSTTDWMTISNVGGASLSFEVTVETPGGAEGASRAGTASGGEIRHLELGKGEEDPRVGPPVIAGEGGPDEFGYRWEDSDEPGGPAYEWIDITGVGTPLDLDDDDYQEVPLPFEFPFYGEMKNSVKVGSNGFLSFGEEALDETSNSPLPDPEPPDDLIAAFWDDLDPSEGGSIYTYYDVENDRFIVEYYNIPPYDEEGSYTFEAILERDGTICYQYQDMNGPLTSATIGIENSDGSVGLQVAFNTDYVHDELAVRISTAWVTWLRVDPISGTVDPDSSQGVEVTFDATRIGAGDYYADLLIASNDPDPEENPDTVSVHLRVEDTIAPSGVTDLDASDPTGDSILLTWTAPGDNDTLGTAAYYDIRYSTEPITEANWADADTATGELEPGPFGSEESFRVTGLVPSTTYTFALKAYDEAGNPSPLSNLARERTLGTPDIAVAPDSFEVALPVDGSLLRLMTISNLGDGWLDFEVGTAPAETLLSVSSGSERAEIVLTTKYKYAPSLSSAAVPSQVRGGVEGQLIEIEEKKRIVVLNAIEATVLYDESHAEHNYLDPEDPNNWGDAWSLGSWRDVLVAAGATVEKLQVGPVTEEILAPYDVFVISPPRDAFSTDEINAIHNYIGSGGSVLLIAEGGGSYTVPDYNINQIISDYGIVLNLDGSSHITSNFADHPIAVGLDTVATWYGTSITGGDPIFYSPVGDLVLMSAGEPGETGRIGIIGDTNIWADNYGISLYDNAQLAVNTIEWLAQAGVPWLSVEPSRGTVPPGGSISVGVTFDAEGLDIGEYHAEILVESNDPDEPMVSVPAALIVATEVLLDISGHVTYYSDGAPVESALVVLSGDASMSDSTDASGFYLLEGLVPGAYTVRAGKEMIHPDPSVDPYDASLKLQEYVGLIALEPYQSVAGDVTGDGRNTPFDASYILRYYVGVDSLPAGGWTFVPERFPVDPTNWPDAPDSSVYAPLDSTSTNENYVGIVIGDVSGNWPETVFPLASRAAGGAGVRTVTPSDISAFPGEEATLSVRIDNGDGVFSAGMTLHYDLAVLEVVDVTPTDLTAGYLIAYKGTEEGVKIGLAGGRPLRGEGSIVDVRFRVLPTVGLNASSEIALSGLKLNEGRIPAAWKSARFAVPLPQTFAVSQNYPNPFNPRTSLKYELPVDARVRIKVYSIAGQVVRELVDEGQKAGYYTVSWDGRDDFGRQVASGIYLCRVQAGAFQAMKKMVILK